MIDILRIALCNIKKWTITPRVYIVLMLLIIFVNMSVNPILNISQTLSEPVSPWLFPFVIGDQYMTSLIFFSLILLLCDAPFISEEHTFMVIRSGKRKFYTAQIIYIMLACAIFVIALILTTIILVSPNLKYTNDWGRILGTLAQTNICSQFQIPLTINYSLMINYSPIEAMLTCALLTWLISVFLGTLMYLLNSLVNRFMGTVIAVIFVLMQYGVDFFYGSAGYWFTPVSWANLVVINLNGQSDHPSLFYCITILTAAIIAMSITVVKVNEKRELKLYSKI